jgi:drug/metabolite transporter (DMT)-like permease
MKKQKEKNDERMVFEKKNYIYMIAGVVLIFLGLILLSGGGSKDPSVFNPDIFDTRRIVIAPVVMLAGFMLEIYAIMYKPKKQNG